MTTTPIEFAAENGQRASGALALPKGEGKAPALIVIHEAFGLNDEIRSTLSRLAAEGFIALAPDLFHGKLPKDLEEARTVGRALDGKQAMSELQGAFTLLQSHARSTGKVGILGFCMGGRFSFQAAVDLPELAAAVPFYGFPPPGTADYSKVRAPIQAHFGSKDPYIPAAGAQEVKARFDELGKPMELHFYDAGHAFMNASRTDVYHEPSAKLAWGRMLGFLREHLG